MKRSVGHVVWQIGLIVVLSLSHVQCGSDKDEDQKVKDKDLDDLGTINLSKYEPPKPHGPEIVRSTTKSTTTTQSTVPPVPVGVPVVTDSTPVGLVKEYPDLRVGRMLVVANDARHALYQYGKQIKVVDLTTGKIVGGLSCWKKTLLAISPDSRYALAGGVSLIDLKTGKSLGETKGVWSRAVFSRDSRTVQIYSGYATGKAADTARPDKDKNKEDGLTISQWDIQSEKLTLAAGRMPATDSVISSDGRLAAYVAKHRMHVVRTKDGEVLRHFRRPVYPGQPKSNTPVAFTPDGQRVVVTDNESLCVWDIESGLEVWRYDELFDKDGEILPNQGKYAFAPKRYNSDQPHPSIQAERAYTPAGWIKDIAVSPDGAFAVTAHKDNVMRVWRLPKSGDWPMRRAKGIVHERGTIKQAYLATFAPDGGELAFVKGRDVKTVPMRQLTAALTSVATTGARWYQQALDLGRPVNARCTMWEMRYFGDARTLALTGIGRYTWTACTDVRVTVPLGGRVRGMSVRADAIAVLGGTLVTAGGSEGLALWATGPRRPMPGKFKDAPTTVTDVEISPDGESIVTTTLDGAAIWSVRGRAKTASLTGHTGGVYVTAFSPDGTWLATGGEDKTVRIWSPQGKPLATLVGHNLTITALAISPDSGLLISAGGAPAHRGELKIWDVKTRKVLAEPRGQRLSVFNMSFSPDGRWLATGSWDATVKLWELTPPRGPAGPVPAGQAIPVVWRTPAPKDGVAGAILPRLTGQPVRLTLDSEPIVKPLAKPTPPNPPVVPKPPVAKPPVVPKPPVAKPPVAKPPVVPKPPPPPVPPAPNTKLAGELRTAKLYIKNGLTEKAKAMLRKIIKDHPATPQAEEAGNLLMTLPASEGGQP